VREELRWIEDHADGKPFGIDVLIPENLSTAGQADTSYKSLQARVPAAQAAFARDLIGTVGVTLAEQVVRDDQPQPFDPGRAMEVLHAAF
jgi:hypothetical protein